MADLENVKINDENYEISDARARANFSDAFDPETEYAAGDYCIYEDILYKFTEAHTGDWDPEAAEQTTVGDELGGLQEENAELAEEISELNSEVSYSLTVDIFTNTLEIRKWGHVCQVAHYGAVSKLAAGTATTYSGIIPEGCRPSYLSVCMGSPDNTIQIRIVASGNLELYNYGSAITSNYSCRFSLCYVTD